MCPIIIERKDGEKFQRMIKRFKRAVFDSEILIDAKEAMHFQKERKMGRKEQRRLNRRRRNSNKPRRKVTDKKR